MRTIANYAVRNWIGETDETKENISIRCALSVYPLLDRRDDLRGAKRKTDGDLLHVHIHYPFPDLQKLLKTAPRGCLTSYSKHTI